LFKNPNNLDKFSMLILLKKYDPLIKFIASLGLPIALAFSGWLVTSSIENSKVDSQYVQIALNILATEYKPDSQVNNAEASIMGSNQLALRRWAIRLLNKKSPERFTEEEQTALLKGQLSPSHILNKTLESIGLPYGMNSGD
jgi:hypothetical protein